MGTEIIKSFGLLQSELDQAKSSLKGVDENIKRLIGRDPSEIIPRPGIKRNVQNEENNRGRQRIVSLNRNRNFNHENDEPAIKRRNTSVFKRLSERPVPFEDEVLQQPQKQLISKVIVTPREVPSRQDALAAQSRDEKSKARNRRMFGALLGTLQKFQQEETKLKSKEQKRAQVEKKIEEHEIREKAEIKKERQELFFNRKKKQAEIKMIELKMTRMKEYAVWEERQRPRSNFILTVAKPCICFLPRRLNDANKALLENCKGDVEKMIEKRRQEVFNELQHIEDRMKKNFEYRKPKDDVQDDPHDEFEVEDKLKTASSENNMNDDLNDNSVALENTAKELGLESTESTLDKMDSEIITSEHDALLSNNELIAHNGDEIQMESNVECENQVEREEPQLPANVQDEQELCTYNEESFAKDEQELCTYNKQSD